jgi:hypothetical protein
MTHKIILHPGEFGTVILPFSEVCMHMRVAGKEMRVQVLDGGMVQLYKDGDRFSFPISAGEAGFHRTDYGYVSENGTE